MSSVISADTSAPRTVKTISVDMGRIHTSARPSAYDHRATGRRPLTLSRRSYSDEHLRHRVHQAGEGTSQREHHELQRPRAVREATARRQNVPSTDAIGLQPAARTP